MTINHILELYDIYGRLGNLMYILLHYGWQINCQPFQCIHNNKFLLQYSYIFKNIIFTYTPQHDYEEVPSETYDVILDNSISYDDVIKYYINYELLNKTFIPLSQPYLVINCRFGDYLNDKNIDTYKAYSQEYHNYIINNLTDVINNYDNIMFVTDDVDLCKQISQNDFTDKNVIYYHSYYVLDDLCMLINADCIIGSCSTFSFIGWLLNKNQAQMYVEYPYYKENNPFNFAIDKQEKLYNHHNIHKIILPKDDF